MPLSKEAQGLLDEFAKQPGVSADHASNLTSIINNSPALVSQINEAVKQGHLKHIVPLPVGTNAGGEYNGTDKEMRLPLSVLASPPAGVPFDAGEPTFVLGHELQHGFNHAATEKATNDFIAGAKTVAEGKGPTHDYTPVLGTLIAANRRDEAGAEVAGWNALVGMVQHTKPNATLEDVYTASPFRAADFIDRAGTAPNYTYTAKPNISLDANLHMQPTAANVEAMGKNYFDHSPARARLGHHGNSDYANYYGAWGTGVIVQSERAYGDGKAQLQMNLQQLHLSENLMEQNGIHLGSDTRPMPYQDTSTTPPTAHHFDHTATTFTHVPIVFEGVRTPGVIPERNGADQPSHPDHALFKQIEAGVSAQGYGHGEDTNRMSHSLLALAKEQGLSRVDHVMLGRDAGDGSSARVFLVEGGLQDPAQRRASMEVAQALQTPQAVSAQKIEEINASRTLAPQTTSAPAQEPARVTL
ncbi:hypothetical protein SAMN05428989_3443 [Pseudoxanthomonas sp. GM95]|uniref:XVIPCD domain-containing protein n=1 Tax=Pseudoxanthomonas sp. GM95 TaxID=1881043 RepID=UPI0008B4470B|nr:XVIPCD domain-containing protein [Pseudoxanthomonas sp. GM95]SEM23271.1 hypothetical protein SAMN05428989_3443 [Pseudoxanthomonas sp. GM95]